MHDIRQLIESTNVVQMFIQKSTSVWPALGYALKQQDSEEQNLLPCLNIHVVNLSGGSLVDEKHPFPGKIPNGTLYYQQAVFSHFKLWIPCAIIIPDVFLY